MFGKFEHYTQILAGAYLSKTLETQSDTSLALDIADSLLPVIFRIFIVHCMCHQPIVGEYHLSD